MQIHMYIQRTNSFWSPGFSGDYYYVLELFVRWSRPQGDMQIYTVKLLEGREAEISALQIKHVSVLNGEILSSGQCIEVSELT